MMDRSVTARSVVQAVGVVVPAHDEAGLLPGCLRALRRAASHPRLRGLPVHLVVVADACRDDTPALAAGGAAGVLEVRHRNVGAARAAGFGEVLRREAGRPTGSLWLATTDADSEVPPDWLAGQLDLAQRGWEVVAGTIRVADWSQQPPGMANRFARRYGAPHTGHPHIHGANLGLSAAALIEVGGMPPMALSEDHALLAALVAHRCRVIRSGHRPVTTSARRQSRAPGGFADYLRQLGAG